MMRLFAETFFRSLGAQTYPLDDELVVELPPHLANVFGKPRLYLVFAGDNQQEPRELSPAEDLVVYGSRTFEQMLDLLTGRGEAAYLCLPSQTPDDLPLTLHHCRLIEQHVHVADEPFYIFNFRAVYLSDEKQEELITVLFDAAGTSRPDKLAELTGGPFLAPEQPPPLEPKTLRQLLDSAGEVARHQAQIRTTELEAALQPRRQKTLLRLSGFYRRLSAEVDTGDPARDDAVRADLQRDLARQVAEELERHRLRVTLLPISYAVLLLPMGYFQLTLATRHTQQTLHLRQNLHTGQIESFDCPACHKPIDRLTWCDGGHAVHPECAGLCHHCDREICQACGLQPCVICRQPVCADCTATCVYCNRWLCAAHTASCAICGQTYCPDHAFHCLRCGQEYCIQCGQKGECATCREAIGRPLLKTTSIPVISSLNPTRYRWQRAENRDFVIYIGRGQGLGSFWWGRAVIVTDRAGTVIYWRRLRGWQS